jgi:hypothetical protein
LAGVFPEENRRVCFLSVFCIEVTLSSEGFRRVRGLGIQGSGIEGVAIDEENEFLTVSEVFIMDKSMTAAIRCFRIELNMTVHI